MFNIYSLPNNIAKKHLFKNSKPDPMFTISTSNSRVIRTEVLKAALNYDEKNAN
jgi:hypothetical protein